MQKGIKIMSKTPLEAAQNLYPYTVNVRGKVSYSHISRLVDGEELRKDNERRRSNNRVQMTRPYSALTITDPVIVDDGTVPDIIKQLINERISSRQNQDGSFSRVWYGTSKSPTLPEVAYSAEAGVELAGKGLSSRDCPLPGELANGLDVTIGVKFFTGNMRPGMGMDYVLVNEPVRYYSGSAIAQALAAQGVTYTAPAPTGAPVQAGPANQPTGGVAPQAAQPMQPQAAAPAPAAPAPAAPMGPGAPSGQIAEAAAQAAVAAAAAAAAQAAQNQAAQQQQAAGQPMVNYGQAQPQYQGQPQPQGQASAAPGLQYTPN